MMEDLYRNLFGCKCGEVKRLPLSGSSRINYRIFRHPEQDGNDAVPKTVIYTEGTSVAENSAFVRLSRYFRSMGLPVPAVYGLSDDSLSYIQEDLGDDSLFSHLDDVELLKRTIALLPDFQFAPDEDFDYSFCFPQSCFDERTISFDLNYFKYCFLKLVNVEFDEIALENDFDVMREKLLTAPILGFMYRDFQSRNVMVYRDGNPYFIDFQGGRRGPVYYDVASFVYQARAAFPANLKEELIECYLDSLEKYVEVDRDEFYETLADFVLFRVLQTLGAYGYRGLFEKKPHFIKSIPFALDNLSELLGSRDFAKDYPYLVSILEKILKCSELYGSSVNVVEPDTLTIEVNSFSYREGIPADLSGNGGGFVFDCRAYENPGRYESFRSLTGRDTEVIDFLEEDGGIVEYLERLYPIVDKHISYFLSRGFDHAMFSFGCTGGQHRSVYCAEHLAEHILARFDVRVILSHKALGISEVL